MLRTQNAASVILKKGEGRTVKSGGSWIYDNEIDYVDGDFEDADEISSCLKFFIFQVV